MLVLPLHGCLAYSQTDNPRPKYYAAITGGEVGLALLGGAVVAPNESSRTFALTSAQVVAPILVLDLVMFGFVQIIKASGR